MADEYTREWDERETVEQIGACGVDSGLLMVVDPAYVLRYKRHEEELRERNATPKEKPTYDDLLDALHNDPSRPRRSSFVDYGGGVVFSTQLGDGVYPVYAIYNRQGELLRVEILIHQYEDDDEEDPLESTDGADEG